MKDYLILMAGMGLVTFLPRWFPLFFLSNREIPKLLIEWLDLIPAAILSALLIPALVVGGEPKVMTFKPELLASIPTFLFALKTKSLGGTVVVGMALYWLIGKGLLPFFGL